MFGISGGEFLIILVIAIAVIPARSWPDVARAAARVVKFVRGVIWKITDATEEIKDRIEREAPIAELSQKTMNDVMNAFRTPANKPRPPVKKKQPASKSKK